MYWLVSLLYSNSGYTLFSCKLLLSLWPLVSATIIIICTYMSVLCRLQGRGICDRNTFHCVLHSCTAWYNIICLPGKFIVCARSGRRSDSFTWLRETLSWLREMLKERQMVKSFMQLLEQGMQAIPIHSELHQEHGMRPIPIHSELPQEHVMQPIPTKQESQSTIIITSILLKKLPKKYSTK